MTNLYVCGGFGSHPTIFTHVHGSARSAPFAVVRHLLNMRPGSGWLSSHKLLPTIEAPHNACWLVVHCEENWFPISCHDSSSHLSMYLPFWFCFSRLKFQQSRAHVQCNSWWRSCHVLLQMLGVCWNQTSPSKQTLSGSHQERWSVTFACYDNMSYSESQTPCEAAPPLPPCQHSLVYIWRR